MGGTRTKGSKEMGWKVVFGRIQLVESRKHGKRLQLGARGRDYYLPLGPKSAEIEKDRDKGQHRGRSTTDSTRASRWTHEAFLSSISRT